MVGKHALGFLGSGSAYKLPHRLQVMPDVPLGRVFKAFREQASEEGWMAPGAAARFLFDGDPVAEEETLDGLGIDEDGMKFDVMIS